MPGDAVTVAPNNYKTLLENDRIRLLEYRGKPGDKTEMHSHPDMQQSQFEFKPGPVFSTS